MPGDAVDLVGESERVLLEPNPVARLGREPLCVLRTLHAIERTSGIHASRNGQNVRSIPHGQ